MSEPDSFKSILKEPICFLVTPPFQLISRSELNFCDEEDDAEELELLEVEPVVFFIAAAALLVLLEAAGVDFVDELEEELELAWR